MWDFVMDKVALVQVFFENFDFPCQSTFHLLLHNHLHYHPRLAQQARSGRSASSLKNQIVGIELFHRREMRQRVKR
jgi:hypothetical protein